MAANIHTIPTQQIDPAPDGTAVARQRRWSSRPLGLLIVIGVCLLFFATTTPKSVPSLLLIVGFVALGLILLAALRLIMMLSGLEKRLAASYRRGILVTVTVLPVLLLMLQSIGQLTVRDVLTLSGLFFIGVFYAARVGRSTRI